MELEKLTAEERLIAEQAILNFRSLNKACDDAKDGTVLAVAEKLAMIQGRKLIRNSLVALGLLLARILHLRRVSAFGKDADGIQFLPQA